MAREVETIKVYADYKGKCENCGNSPVVSLTGLCGPCTFGSADALDPTTWEGDYETPKDKKVNPRKER